MGSSLWFLCVSWCHDLPTSGASNSSFPPWMHVRWMRPRATAKGSPETAGGDRVRFTCRPLPPLLMIID